MMRTSEDEFYATHIAPDASDEEISDKVADYLVTMFPRSRVYCLSVIHDLRPTALRRLERMRKIRPDYQPEYPVGSCPLRYDWTLMNTVGITTRDQARARLWAVEATLAGYGVFRRVTRAGAGFGKGSLKQIRALTPTGAKP
jgi:hypothetical protein